MCVCVLQAVPGIVQETKAEVFALAGRPYGLFSYHGHPQAERVVAAMGSSTSVLEEAADWLNTQGQRVGLVKVGGGAGEGDMAGVLLPAWWVSKGKKVVAGAEGGVGQGGGGGRGWAFRALTAFCVLG